MRSMLTIPSGGYGQTVAGLAFAPTGEIVPESDGRLYRVIRDSSRRRPPNRYLLFGANLFDHFKAIHLRHLHVEKDEIGSETLDRSDCVAPVRSFTDDVDFCVGRECVF